MSAISPGILMMFSAGMGAVSSGISGIAQYKQGQAQQAAYEYNADVALRKMRQDRETSRLNFSRLMGRQRSLYAKAGVDIASGSPLLILADTAMKAEEEQIRIKESGESEAEIQRYYGRVAASTATTGAWNTFLTGLGTAATQLYKAKKG